MNAPAGRDDGPVSVPAELLDRFALADPAFIADPYPVLSALRETAPVFFYEPTNAVDGHAVQRRVRGAARSAARAGVHASLHPCRRSAARSQIPAGRSSTSTSAGRCCSSSRPTTPASAGLSRRSSRRRRSPSLRPTIEAFSRRTPRRVRRPRPVRPPGRLRAAVLGRRHLLACSACRGPTPSRLLDWSHAIVKMYELTASDDASGRGDASAAEFMDYTAALIADDAPGPTISSCPRWPPSRTRANG